MIKVQVNTWIFDKMAASNQVIIFFLIYTFHLKNRNYSQKSYSFNHYLANIIYRGKLEGNFPHRIYKQRFKKNAFEILKADYSKLKNSLRNNICQIHFNITKNIFTRVYIRYLRFFEIHY